MPKYIELEKAINLFYPVDPENDGSDGCTTVLKSEKYSSEEIESMLSDLPVSDVAPVVHAKWIYLGKGGDFSWQIDGRGQSWDIWECSNCKCKSCGSPQPKRCPHCDAKMDLEG